MVNYVSTEGSVCTNCRKNTFEITVFVQCTDLEIEYLISAKSYTPGYGYLNLH